MAAASFLVPGLSGWSARPNRIKASPRINSKRRERLTPPWTNDDIANRFKLTELETVQERHIQERIGEYLKPFRWFLTALGRFPYSVDGEGAERKRKAGMIFLMISELPTIIRWKFGKVEIDTIWPAWAVGKVHPKRKITSNQFQAVNWVKLVTLIVTTYERFFLLSWWFFFSAMAFKKVSIIPIIENGMSKEPEEIEPPTLTIYKYTPCSIKGFLFYLTTILAMIILGNQICKIVKSIR